MRKLWYNGLIYTMAKEGETVEAILTEGDQILQTGALAQLTELADERVDLKGAVMYPGFVDSHIHMIMYGQKLQRLDLSKAESTQEMLELLQERAATLQGGEWLFGEGWNENNFPDRRIPSIEELDIVYKGPIILSRICHHVYLCNTEALQRGGITRESENRPGGEIGRDIRGELNGLLYEQAKNPVYEAAQPQGEAFVKMLEESLHLAVDDMLKRGIVGAHTEEMNYFGHYTNPLTAYKNVMKKEHFRVNLLRHHEVFEQMMQDGARFEEPYVEPGAMKIFADGSLGGSTAALSEPYEDNRENFGMLIHTDEKLEDYVKLARQYGEAIAVHLIGDAGVEQLLNVVEKYPAPEGKRDRFIHCCVLREDLVARMKQLPIVLDLQPAFVTSDFPWVEKKLGQERLSWAYAWKRLLSAGFMCAAGTDAPIEEVEPLKTIYAAVERKLPDQSHEGYGESEKLSRFEAVKMYTYGSAQAICKEHERGLIQEGYVADFTIFDRDLFEGSTEDMLKANVEKTVVGGKVVYQRKDK